MNDNFVLVTGASSDIGVELVRRLATGPSLVLAHANSNLERLEQLAGSVGEGGRIIPLRADLRRPAEVEGLIATALGRYGTPRALVHLPALPLQLVRFKDQTWESLLADLELQLRAAMLLLQGLLPHMKEQEPRAKVVLMLSSVTCGVPPASMTGYVVAKYALLGLMRALSVEYADKGVNVNAVSPSMVETKFLDKTPHKYVEISAAKSPLRRNASVQDVVPLIQFLLSPESDYMTGVNIPVAAGIVV